MQGPAGSWQPRRAGEQRPDMESGQDGTRDWQRYTWDGPSPKQFNPFDEPEDAPELRAFRSDNVNEHMGDFWNQEPTGYQYGSGQAAFSPAKEKKRLSGRKKRLLALTPVVVLLAVFLVLRFGVYAVRDIQVDGNRKLTAEQIIQLSGIHPGDGILFISNEQVEKRINADYRVTFRYLEKHMPNQVVIHIREREPCCWVSYCGIFYAMDRSRMVLDESEIALAPEEGGSWNKALETEENRQELERVQVLMDTLAEVKGLDIRSGNHLGQTIILGSSEQQEALDQLFVEMKVLSCTGLIREADLGNLESAFLVTRDGFTVALGTADRFHAKLRSMLLVRQELLNMGYTGGTINVTNPVSPSFSPPEG